MGRGHAFEYQYNFYHPVLHTWGVGFIRVTSQKML